MPLLILKFKVGFGQKWMVHDSQRIKSISLSIELEEVPYPGHYIAIPINNRKAEVVILTDEKGWINHPDHIEIPCNPYLSYRGPGTKREGKGLEKFLKYVVSEMEEETPHFSIEYYTQEELDEAARNISGRTLG